ncbi:hypothetical protein N0V88_007511 [Collariella sp. IMI 366227]|nr:hypothetical protein N0V88_007511 [Collariella sp. IMI 366227]
MDFDSIPGDYYEVLGVAQNADESLIKASYRRLAKLQHPDKNPDGPTANARFQLLQEAYSTLIDPTTRYTYDTISHIFIRARKAQNQSPSLPILTTLTSQHTFHLHRLSHTLASLASRRTAIEQDLLVAQAKLSTSTTIKTLDPSLPTQSQPELQLRITTLKLSLHQLSLDTARFAVEQSTIQKLHTAAVQSKLRC